MSIHQSLYDTKKTYHENFAEGPFGDFADGVIIPNEGEPQFSFLGKPVYAPFGIAAGPLPNNRFVKAAWDKGFDIITFKSVRTTEYPCNAMPNVLPIENETIGATEMAKGVTTAPDFKEKLTVANSFGIPSLPPEEWKEEIKKTLALKGKGQVLINAFQGTDRKEGFDAFLQDHVKGIQMLLEVNPEILEINLSCPNEGNHKLMCFDVEGTEKIMAAVKEVRGDTPLLVKIAYFADKDLLDQFVQKVGSLVDGIVAINTLGIPVKNPDGTQAFPGEGRQKAGVSGYPVKWAGLEMVKSLVEMRAKHSLNFSVIGVGGVLNAADYKEYLDAGADAVMSVAGAMWNGYLAKEIKDSIK